MAIEAARRSFLASGPCLGKQSLGAEAGVRAEVLASWQRARRHDVDPDRLAPRFAGHPASPSLATACAEEVFDEFFKLNGEAEASLILADAAGVIRVRRDGQDTLARLLDGVRLITTPAGRARPAPEPSGCRSPASRPPRSAA